MTRAIYTNEEMTSVRVNLEDGEDLGNFTGPAEFFFTLPSPGNREHDALEVLVAEGKIEIEPFVPPPPALRDDISRRQFYEQAFHAGDIDEDEMLAAMGGKIPAVLLAKVNTLPAEARLKAKSLLAGAGTFYLSDPMAMQLAQLMGYTEETIRDYWRAAAAL